MIISKCGIWQKLIDIYGFKVPIDDQEDLEMVYPFCCNMSDSCQEYCND